MKKIVASVVVVVLFAISGGSAQAGILGYAHTAFTNFELRTDTFDGGVERTLDASDFSALAFADSSNASATLSGFAGVATASPTADVLPSQINIALANNTFAQQAAGSEPFSRGDTGGSGALITGLPPAVGTAPASIDAMAEVQLVNSANGALGTADSRVGTNAAFSFTTLGGINFIVDFDAALDLQAMLDVPFGEASEAAVGFSITVTDDNNNDALVFLWSPNGTGTSFGGTVTNDPYSLNQGVSQLAVDGSTTVTEASQNFRANILLAAGSYTVNINATADVSASTVLIPEPTSILVWGLTGVVVLVGARRRRRINQV